MDSGHEREGERAAGEIPNISTPLVPISKVPNELLLEILRTSAQEGTNREDSYFDTLLCHDQRYSFSKLLTLTHVCADWGKTIISTTSFWQYIDMRRFNIFHRANAVRCVKIILERSAARPLCFDVMFPPCLGKKGMSGPIPPPAEYLLPHMHRIQSFYLGGYGHTQEVVDFLSPWFSMARAPTFPTHTLVIWRELDHDPNHARVYYPAEHQTSHALLSSIRVLRLDGFVFEWTSTAYRNLVHLHLNNLSSEASPSIDEIMDILAARSELQILQLTDMCVGKGERNHQEPVTLNRLKVLDLAYIHRHAIGLLLPLLVIPQTNAISLKFRMHTPRHVSSSAALAFLARTNVYSLSIATARHEGDLGRYLSAAKNVKILILDISPGKGSGDRALSAMTQVPSSLRPRICTIYLCDAFVKEKSLRNLAESYPSIRKLRDIRSIVEIEGGSMALMRELQNFITDTATRDYFHQGFNFRWYDIMT